MSRAVRLAHRRYTDAVIRRHVAGVEAIKAGGAAANLLEEYERPIWNAALAALDGYVADQNEPFPPEIAICIAGALREMLTSGLPATWAVLRHQGGPDMPVMTDCKRAAVAFLSALSDPVLGPLMREFQTQAFLSQKFGVSTTEIAAWLEEAKHDRRWDDGSAIPYQHISLFRVLGHPADLKGVAAAFGGKAPNTVRGWQRDHAATIDHIMLFDRSDYSLPERVVMIWAAYAGGAAGYRSLSYRKRRRGTAKLR